MIEIDGSLGEGGGQILRTSLSLATIFGKRVRISKIRAKRKEPGLRPQHLQAVLAAASMCRAKLRGANVGSIEIEFEPGPIPREFHGLIDTSTAASVSLIAQTLIPIAIFTRMDLDVEIRGGTEVPNSPTIDYIQRLVVPVYEKLGATVQLTTRQRGYYPRGGGIVAMKCTPGTNLQPEPLFFNKKKDDLTDSVTVLSVSRQLPDHVSKRQIDSARIALQNAGITKITSTLDNYGSSLSPGSSVLIFRKTDDLLIGSSSLGERGKKAEVVGEEASRGFLSEISKSPNVDSHLADMLVVLLPCVDGTSRFRTSFVTNHFTTTAEIAKRIVDCEINYQKDGLSWLVNITGSSEKPN